MVTTTSAFPSVGKVMGGFTTLEPLYSKTCWTSASAQATASLPKASALSIFSTWLRPSSKYSNPSYLSRFLLSPTAVRPIF